MEPEKRFSPECDFCDIARGEDPAWFIYEKEAVIAFLPLKPVVDGHTLVVPRTHVRTLWELQRHLASDLIGAVVKVAGAINRTLTPDGLNLIQSNGDAASQTIFHVHFHLVPRWESDSMGDIWPPSFSMSVERKAETVEALRGALAEGE